MVDIFEGRGPFAAFQIILPTFRPLLSKEVLVKSEPWNGDRLVGRRAARGGREVLAGSQLRRERWH